jgi:hypothetical protein
MPETAFGARRPAILLQLSALAALLLFTAPTFAQKTTVIVTAAPTIPSEAPQFTDEDAFTSAVLNSTNFYRAAHNASAVAWNDTLATFAADYLEDDVGSGDDCKFAHSGGPYGENLALGCSNATSCVEAWGEERKKYDYRAGKFSEDTGHFTQLVWKNTTDVGCGKRLCGAKGWYLACEYWPRGNVVGAFKEEVNKPVNAAARRSRSNWLVSFMLGVFLWIIV